MKMGLPNRQPHLRCRLRDNSGLVLEARKSAALIEALWGGEVAELEWLAALALSSVNLGQVGNVICSALCRALVTVAAFGVWHLTSSLGIGLPCGAEG